MCAERSLPRSDPAACVVLSGRSHGRRGGCIALLALAAVAATIAVASAIDAGVELRSPPSRAQAGSVAELATVRPELAPLLVVRAPDRPAVQAARVVTDASVSRGDAVTTDVCGYGPVTLPPDDPDPAQQLPPALRAAALADARAEMAGSADPQVRAAALLIALRSNTGDAQSALELLAREATASQDPAVYAIALEACRGFDPAAGACTLLSRAQWARLDADNVVPWLELGADAHARGEADAESDAMGHAALARRSDGYEELLPALVERAIASGAPSLRLALALTAGRSAQTIWSAARSGRVYDYCSAGIGADAVRQRCDAIADVLVRRSVSLADRRTGIAIGGQLGWPPERLRAASEPLATSVDRVEPATLELDLSCDAVARIERSLRRVASRDTATAEDSIARAIR